MKKKGLLLLVGIAALTSCNVATSTSSSSSSSASSSQVSTSSTSSTTTTSTSTSSSTPTSTSSSSVSTSSSSSTSSTTTTSINTLKSISLNTEAYILSITNDVQNPTTTLSVTTNPTSFADETVTWTSSNESVATVENGVVSALSVGTTTITATVLDKTATCEITVEKNPFDNITDINVTDLGTEELNQKLYRISGVVENINSISNLFQVVDTNGTGKYVTVNRIGYSVQKENDFVFTDDKITYESPNVFEGLEIEEGKYVTIVGIYYSYAREFYFDGYLENITDGTEIDYKAAVSVNDNSFGTATLSKTEGVKWGEEVEVEVTPESGYAVSEISHNGYPVSANEEGKYIFKATAKNDVTVTFAKNTVTTTIVNFSDLGETGFTYPSTDVYVTLKNSGSNDPKYQYSTNSAATCLILQGSSDEASVDGNSIDTIKDLGGNITKVTITGYGQRAGTIVGIYGTNDEYDAEKVEDRTWTKISDLEFEGKGTASLATYTVEISGSYKYIRIQLSSCAEQSVKQARITSISYSAN